MARDIPGFYYDEEKGKYFRIQQSHRVAPGTGHTHQSVREARRAKEEQQRVQHQAQRRRLGNIVRSPIFAHSRSSLAHSVGATAPRLAQIDVARQYGAGLSRCYVDARRPPFEGLDRQFLGSSISITRSGLLRAYYKCPLSSYGYEALLVQIQPNRQSDDTVDLPFTQLTSHWAYTPRFTDLLTSVYTTEGQESVVFSCDSSTRCVLAPVDANGRHGGHGWLELDIMRMSEEMIWDIAAAPSAPTVAIATNTGLMIGDCHDLGTLSFSSSDRLSGREQMNVSFKDANIIMSSERSGRINFTDTRNNQSVVRLLHSSAVLGTLPLPLRDSNQILAHGFSTTSVYDLRWVQQTPVHDKARSGNLRKRSRPYLDLAVPKNRWTDNYSRGRKIACSTELDLVAAVSSNANCGEIRGFVTLYSTRTGKVVDSPLNRHMYYQTVRSVDVRRVRDGPESIFCLSGDRLEEWAYGRMTRAEYNFYDIDCTSDNGPAVPSGSPPVSIEQRWDRGHRN